MGLFDGAFNPNLGWLGLQPTQNDQTSPLDISALIQAFGGGGMPQGQYGMQSAPMLNGNMPIDNKSVTTQGDANALTGAYPNDPLLSRLFAGTSIKPRAGSFFDALVNGGGAQAAPQQLPATTPQMPPLAAPREVGAAPRMNAPSSPQGFGPTLDQRAYGAPGQASPMPSAPIGGAPQMPQQAQAAMAQAPKQNGDFLGGLSNFSSNLQNNPGVGGIINALRGIQTGEQYGGSALQKTGTDPMTGQDTFAWVNPQNQTIKPTAIGDGTQAQGPSLGAFSDAVKAGVQGQALYEYLPPSMKSTVKSMIEGRMSPPTGAALRSPQTMALINAANSIDPNFDAANWGVRSSLAKNYLAGGKQFQEMQAIGTVAGHLENLAKSADALGNTDYPMVNGVVNWVRQNTGDPRIARFGTDVQAVSNELSKAYRGGHVTEGDVKEWNSKINAASSPAQLKAVIGEFNDLLRSKREMIETGYKQGMGGVPLPSEFSSESEKSRKTFDNVAKWSGGETQSPQAQSAPTATGPNGQKIILRNGQWVPLK